MAVVSSGDLAMTSRFIFIISVDEKLGLEAGEVRVKVSDVFWPVESGAGWRESADVVLCDAANDHGTRDIRDGERKCFLLK